MAALDTSIYPCLWFVGGPGLPHDPECFLVAAFLAQGLGLGQGFRFFIYDQYLLVFTSFCHYLLSLSIGIAHMLASLALPLALEWHHHGLALLAENSYNPVNLISIKDKKITG